MKKFFKITSITLGVVIALVLAVLIFLGQSTFNFVKITDANQNYNRVLKTAYEQNENFGEVPISKISLLAAHDSLSYDINYHSNPNTSEDTMSNNGFWRTLGRGFIARISRAQAHDIYTQLNAGVRYIDARITNIDGQFYTSHGLVSGTLEKSLLQILKFLDENPGEYVVFHIVHYYPGQSSWQQLNEYIHTVKYNGKSLFDYVNYDIEGVNGFAELTYNKMTANGSKAGVIFIGEDSESSFKSYYKLNNVNSVWHNVTDSDEIIGKIASHCEKAKTFDENTLCINQTQTTPNFNAPFKTIFSWSLIDAAAGHNQNVLNNENFDEWLKAMPIYLCDYSTSNDGDFNNRINSKILEYNLSL